MGFGDKFNDWLIEQGKEPISPELIEIMNESMRATIEKLKQHEGEMVKEMQELAADYCEGKPVDPEQRAKDFIAHIERQEHEKPA